MKISTNYNGVELSIGCTAISSDLKDGEFENLDLSGSDFQGCDFTESTFDNCDLSDCDFNNADLSGVWFTQTDLSGCDFKNADLTDCAFGYKVKLAGSDFRGATMENTCVQEMDLTTAKIEEKDLRIGDPDGPWRQSAILPVELKKFEPDEKGNLKNSS